MAHANWHGQIVKVFHNPTTDWRIGVTSTNVLILTKGKRGGKARILRGQQGKFAKFGDEGYTAENFYEAGYHSSYPCCEVAGLHTP